MKADFRTKILAAMLVCQIAATKVAFPDQLDKSGLNQFLQEIHEVAEAVTKEMPQNEGSAQLAKITQCLADSNLAPDELQRLAVEYPKAAWFAKSLKMYIPPFIERQKFSTVDELDGSPQPLSFYFLNREFLPEKLKWKRADFYWPALRRGAVMMRLSYIESLATLVSEGRINSKQFNGLAPRAIQDAMELADPILLKECTVSDYVSLVESMQKLLVGIEVMKSDPNGAVASAKMLGVYGNLYTTIKKLTFGNSEIQKVVGATFCNELNRRLEQIAEQADKLDPAKKRDVSIAILKNVDALRNLSGQGNDGNEPTSANFGLAALGHPIISVLDFSEFDGAVTNLDMNLSSGETLKSIHELSKILETIPNSWTASLIGSQNSGFTDNLEKLRIQLKASIN